MKIVVKIGGSLLKGPVPQGLVEDVKALSSSNQIALVHGGGEIVTEMAVRLGKEQRFVVSPEGIRSRYTDRETADIYTMVMSGLVAKKLVVAFIARGVRAVSISGLDGSLMVGKRKKKLVTVDERGRKMLIEGGYTGRVETVNSGLADLLMSNGYVPVVSPVASSEGSEPLNIDGDRAAASLAVGIHADAVIFLTNVDGLILDGKLVEASTPDGAEMRLREVGFGMQKKVMASVEAVRGGLKEAIICSGTRADPLANALAHKGCTVIS
jgi:[amino group carrier protein]-L-2-aminoadipate 6-kinase